MKQNEKLFFNETEFWRYHSENTYLIPSASISNTIVNLNNAHTDPSKEISYEKKILTAEQTNLLNYSGSLLNTRSPDLVVVSEEYLHEFSRVIIEIAEELKQNNFDALILPLRGPYPIVKHLMVMDSIDVNKMIPIPFTGEFKSVSFLKEALKTIDLSTLNLVIIDTGKGGGGINRMAKFLNEYAKQNTKQLLKVYFIYIALKDFKGSSANLNPMTERNLHISIKQIPVSHLLFEDFDACYGIKAVTEDSTYFYKTYKRNAEIVVVKKDVTSKYIIEKSQDFDDIIVKAVNKELFEKKNYQVYSSNKPKSFAEK